MTRVLMTGATGFIGRHALVHLAARDCSIHAAALDATTMALPAGVEPHDIDLHDTEAVNELVASVRPDALLHLAWNVAPERYWTSLDNLRWVQASLALFEAFIACGGRRAVCAGTAAEYDWRFGYCSESVTPLQPKSLYAASKHGLGEMLTATAKQVGFSFAWGRVFFLYGPYEAPVRLVPSMIRSVLDNQPVRLKHPELMRDYLHVEDVGAAFVAILFSPVEGAINIASGEAVRLRDIGRAVFRALDKLERFEDMPSEPDPYPVVIGSAARLRDEVGFTPRFSFETGIRNVVSWWQENA